MGSFVLGVVLGDKMEKLGKRLKKIFPLKRIYTSLSFSMIICVSYWVTTTYEKAFESGLWWGPIIAFLLIAVVLLIFGGSILDELSRD